jgi:hypothetical protein
MNIVKMQIWLWRNEIQQSPSKKLLGDVDATGDGPPLEFNMRVHTVQHNSQKSQHLPTTWNASGLNWDVL